MKSAMMIGLGLAHRYVWGMRVGLHFGKKNRKPKTELVERVDTSVFRPRFFKNRARQTDQETAPEAELEKPSLPDSAKKVACDNRCASSLCARLRSRRTAQCCVPPLQ